MARTISVGGVAGNPGSGRRNIEGPRKHTMGRYVVLLLAPPLMGLTFLDPVARKNEEGNRLFRKGDFEGALQHYRDAQVEDPERPQLHYNAGCALYKTGAYDDAVQEFARAVDSEDGLLSAAAAYNLGNAYFRQQKLKEALEMYKRTLEMDPGDLDAKINLEYVQSLLEQQKNQQAQSDQEQQQQQDQERDKQQGEDGRSQQDEDRPSEQDQHKQEDQDAGQQERDSQQQAGEPDQDRPEDQQASQDVPREEGELTVEEAERILGALKDRELQAQKRRRILLRGRTYHGNEW